MQKSHKEWWNPEIMLGTQQKKKKRVKVLDINFVAQMHRRLSWLQTEVSKQREPYLDWCLKCVDSPSFNTASFATAVSLILTDSPCWVRCVVIGLLLDFTLSRRSTRCPQPTLLTSEQLMVWAWCVLLDLWSQLSSWVMCGPPPWLLVAFSRPPPWLLVAFSRPPPWLLVAFRSSSAQWCSVNTTPSRGSAHQLGGLPGCGAWIEHKRFRRWMRTRVACPPYQVGFSCQTTKVLSQSRAPTPHLGWLVIYFFSLDALHESSCGGTLRFLQMLTLFKPFPVILRRFRLICALCLHISTLAVIEEISQGLVIPVLFFNGIALFVIPWVTSGCMEWLVLSGWSAVWPAIFVYFCEKLLVLDVVNKLFKVFSASI